MSAASSSAHAANYVHSSNTVKSSLIHKISRWHVNWRTRRQLARLPDFMLQDIGISRIDAEQEARKPFWTE
ncbi:hypothetical protein A6779_11960 [Marinobacter adhaerens]|uniref:YjiS-like domain-containing protein n=1 Tax=Marinobacter salsuginis TaxID=418719 RepID=A0A5M3PL56_9GAMM|nr:MULTISPECIES: DUF1127 domain-containing protein [Marinobacter]ODM29836.1 hypothetical protein A6779_11960 [Marinobacter adhaerens]GBO83558.1 hypothetical protein MS5N3_10090 [Marinobacter salsuginis]|tara:strand:+ start:1882 stop:2094 length:213 start_codon:yes stop_codon:yes gene_type:complete